MIRKLKSYKRLVALVLAGCISLSIQITAQSLSTSTPEQAGFSMERLQRIDPVLQGFVDRGNVAGTVALVIRDGKIIYHKGFGYDDIDAKSPLKKDAIFRIASQTKAITSLAVMMLFEEGKFLLDDPISKFIPTFKEPKVLDNFNPADSTYTSHPAKREVRIRDLLTHTSGVSYAMIGSKEATAIYAKNKIPSGLGTPMNILSDAIPALGKMPLIHEPGAKWTYGLNTDILGYLVEVTSGMTLDAFFRTRIFEPLGMKDTYFYQPKVNHARLANLYETTDEGKLRKMPLDDDWSVYPKLQGTYFSGGAGLSSTAYDYSIFLQMLLNGGVYNGKRILAPSIVGLMIQNQIGDLEQGRNKFGLGFSVASAEEAARIPLSEGTFEWGGIFGTTYWADPKQRVIGLLMTQNFPNPVWGRMQDQFKVMVYQAIVK